MPKICEKWLGLVNSCVYYARQTHEIYLGLPGSFEIHWGRQYWDKCSFIWNKGPVNIWNDHKAQK